MESWWRKNLLHLKQKWSAFFDLYVYDFQNWTEKKIDLEDSMMRVFNISDISKDGRRLLCFCSEIGSRLNELYVVDVYDGKN